MCVTDVQCAFSETSGDVYFGELMVESNVTLNAHDIESALKDLPLTVDVEGKSHNVAVLLSEVISGIFPERCFLSRFIIYLLIYIYNRSLIQ